MGPSRDVLQKRAMQILQIRHFRSGKCVRSRWVMRQPMQTTQPMWGKLGAGADCSVEFAVGVYEALHQAGQNSACLMQGIMRLKHCGLKKGYRAWSRELTPDINPYEAGLGFTVAMDKSGEVLSVSMR